jgi:dCTP deaminase
VGHRLGTLVVSPRPEELGEGYDETSIDLHLDRVDEARVWNEEKLERRERTRGGRGPEVHIGRFNYGEFSEEYLVPPPAEDENTEQKVCQRGNQIIVRPSGFLLWTTKEVVGTPAKSPELICFLNAKSTRARTGILVHFTAPTIHAGWQGNITLEIANLGPFHFVLQENDVIAQLTVATISSPPDLRLKKGKSQTAGQAHASGKPTPSKDVGRRRRK